ncbi:MAG TPA: dihydrofolate reductase family protein [Ktedonobacterales bacterium]|nr:dihydrofolate reductase family protein [Ktedonobacterales bacterium]
MSALEPLATLYASERGPAAPLPAELTALYGRLDFAPHAGRPYVIGNFVSSLDGVVALNIPGVRSGGGEISGFNEHDRMVMGLLRAIAGAVVVGAGTLRSVPNHRWTANYIYPSLAQAYQRLRADLGLTEPPLTVIVSARGEVDLSWPVFQSGETPTLLVTTRAGANRLDGQALPPPTRLSVVEDADRVSAAAVLEAISRERACDIILTEGGPLLMSDFFAEHLLDELFLTLAPQVAGRVPAIPRPGFVDGMLFAPDQPIWGTLVDIRRGGSHLFLRYAFEAARR